MPIRRAARSPLAACAVLAALLALSGCDLAARTDRARGADAGPAPTGAESSQPSEQPEAPERSRPRPRTSTVTLDDVVLRIVTRKAATVQTDEDGPSTRTVTLSLAPGGSARIALDSPGALDVDSDGSIAVLDGQGTPVAAVSPPASASGTGNDAPRIEVTDLGATEARVEVDRPRVIRGSGSAGTAKRTGPLPVAFVVGTDAIESATWGENEGGRSLAVDPTDWARHAGQAGLDLIRTQLVAAEPDAGSSTMGDQLVCHAVGAPDKATWNLEPWRPDVGLILTATAHCNPV
ncbi:DUF2599 domain-containing protein [Promicromonospora iranensis]|uniref:DUF2599 domain-containing protein n=1 Tax=Promicromonospora iranensis TaxID=1105144 RepID=UPI0023A93FD7|nr:DUF2599 domain-containing protein [Promicromonospora iranensis]